MIPEVRCASASSVLTLQINGFSIELRSSVLVVRSLLKPDRLQTGSCGGNT